MGKGGPQVGIEKITGVRNIASLYFIEFDLFFSFLKSLYYQTWLNDLSRRIVLVTVAETLQKNYFRINKAPPEKGNLLYILKKRIRMCPFNSFFSSEVRSLPVMC